MESINISQEYLIQPYAGGVKLAIPNYDSFPLNSVKETFSLPVNSYFLGTDGTLVDINENTFITNFSELTQVSTKRDVLNKNIRDYLTEESSQKLLNNGIEVISHKKMKIFEEEVMISDETFISGLTFKFPVYSSQDRIIGIFGLSILVDIANPLSSSFINSLDLITKTGLLSQGAFIQNCLPGQIFQDAYLSCQEIRCLKLFIRGMTVKMVAKALKISPRTVETYLNNLKTKLNVKSKSELIDKMITSLIGPF